MMNDIVDPRIAVLVVWAFFFFAFIVLPSFCLRCLGCCHRVDGGGMGSGESHEMGSVYNFLSARKRAELDELRVEAIEGCLEEFSMELGREHMVKLPEIEEEKETPETCACPDDFIDEELGEDEHTHIQIPLPGYDRDGVQAREKPIEEEESSNNAPWLPFFLKKVQATDGQEKGKEEGGTKNATIPDEAIRTDERRTVPRFCAVCLGEYELSDTIAWASNPECSHVFHKECIGRWLDSLGRKALSRGFGRVPDGSSVLNYGLECPCCRQAFVSSVVLANRGRSGEESA